MTTLSPEVHSDSKHSGKTTFWLLAVGALLLGVALRVINLQQYPISSDEILHMLRIYDIVGGQPFTGIDQNKWLYGYIVALFNTTGPESAWVARCTNAMWAAVSVACCINLGKTLHSQQAGLLAGLLYAVSAMGIFHERRALYDPMMTATAMLALIIMISLARRPRLWPAILMTVALLVSRLTKPAMVGFFAMPFITLALIRLMPDGRIPGRQQIRERLDKKFWLGFSYSAISIVVVLAITALVYQAAAAQGFTPRDTHTVALKNTIAGGNFAGGSIILHILFDLRDILFISLSYWSVGIVLCVIAGVVWLVASPRHRTQLLLLSFPALIFLGIPMAAIRPAEKQEFIFPRYLVINGPAICVFAAIGLLLTYQYVLPKQRALQTLLTAAVVIPTLVVGSLFMFDPVNIEAVLGGRHLPFYRQIDWHGLSPFARDASHIIAQDWIERTGEDPYAIMATYSEDEFRAYLGPRIGPIFYINKEDTTALPYWVAQTQQVYVVEDEEGYRLPDFFSDYDLTLVHSEDEAEEGRQWLWRVEQLTGQPADDVFTHLAAAPETMSADYDALIPQMSNGAVYVFPVNHAPYLAELISQPVEPLAVGQWPLSVEAAQGYLLEMGTQHGRIGVVLVDEANTDQQHDLLRALYTSNLYPYHEAWSGLLHYIAFATGPADPDVTPLDAEWENVIRLEEAAILDSQTSADQPVRMSYEWVTGEAIQDRFSVFTHIIDQEGNLLTQHDGEPGNGLFPTTSWAPGERITNRFAITLPPDTPPGTYTVQVGLYNPANGVRLQATNGRHEANAIFIGEIVVK